MIGYSLYCTIDMAWLFWRCHYLYLSRHVLTCVSVCRCRWYHFYVSVHGIKVAIFEWLFFNEFSIMFEMTICLWESKTSLGVSWMWSISKLHILFCSCFIILISIVIGEPCCWSMISTSNHNTLSSSSTTYHHLFFIASTRFLYHPFVHGFSCLFQPPCVLVLLTTYPLQYHHLARRHPGERVFSTLPLSDLIHRALHHD